MKSYISDSLNRHWASLQLRSHSYGYAPCVVPRIAPVQVARNMWFLWPATYVSFRAVTTGLYTRNTRTTSSLVVLSVDDGAIILSSKQPKPQKMTSTFSGWETYGCPILFWLLRKFFVGISPDQVVAEKNMSEWISDTRRWICSKTTPIFQMRKMGVLWGMPPRCWHDQRCQQS